MYGSIDNIDYFYVSPCCILSVVTIYLKTNTNKYLKFNTKSGMRYYFVFLKYNNIM